MITIIRNIKSINLSTLVFFMGFLVFFANVSSAQTIECSDTTLESQDACDAQLKCAWDSVTSKCMDRNAFEVTLCNLLRLVTGTGGKAFAAFAIISVGIGFFTGKVSWGLMIGVAAGIAAIFGAPTIVSAISGGSKVNANNCGGTVNDLS